MLLNISVNSKYGFHFVIHAEHFRSQGHFIVFSVDNFDVCSIYANDIDNFYSFEYRIVDGNVVNFDDMLFSDGKIIKII